jgi:hypothetical protein
MALIMTSPIVREYRFSPFDYTTKKLLAGCYRAFVKEVEVCGEDRIRGSIVHEGARYTLVITASLVNGLRKPKDKVRTRVSFQSWSDELVAIVKMDEAKTIYTQELYNVFGDSNV